METEKEGPEMHSVSVSLFSALTQNPRYRDTSANYGIPMRRSNQNFTAKSSPLSLSVSLSFLFHGSEISVEQTVFCSYSNGKETYQTNKEITSFIPFLFFLSFFHRNRNSDNKAKLPNSAFAALTNTKTSSSSENTPKNSAKPRAENGAMVCAQKENLANPWRREEGGGGVKPVST
jgi:hypothetical protein